jgi:hypothetical protein
MAPKSITRPNVMPCFSAYKSGKKHQTLTNNFRTGMVCTVAKGIRAALLYSNLPPEFWGFAAVNWVDVYNQLPHSSIDDMTPWEVEKGTKPDVSMFRPFGCRVTVFGGREHAKHHKISARGEACVFVGLGYHAGHKGWVCYSPALKCVFCTRNCLFDETFMPMRTYDQHILGFFDTTPRRQMLAAQHGDPEIATQIPDEIMNMDLQTSKAHLLRPCKTRKLIASDAHEMVSSDSSEDEHQPKRTRKRAPAKQRATASDFFQAATAASGGVKAVTTASGGVPAPATAVTPASGGITATSQAATPASGGVAGAKRGRTSNTLNAPAGGNQCHTGGWDDSFDITEIGHKYVYKATDAEVFDWLVANGIVLKFHKRFFKYATADGPFEGLVINRTAHKTLKGKVFILDTAQAVRGFPISTAEHSNSIRNAIQETYPGAKTLADLKNMHDKSCGYEGSTVEKTPTDVQPPTNAKRAAATLSRGTKSARFAFAALLAYVGVMQRDVSKIYKGVPTNWSSLYMDDSIAMSSAVAFQKASKHTSLHARQRKWV